MTFIAGEALIGSYRRHVHQLEPTCAAPRIDEAVRLHNLRIGADGTF